MRPLRKHRVEGQGASIIHGRGGGAGGAPNEHTLSDTETTAKMQSVANFASA